MNSFYQAECSSTHFWGSDFEIFGFEGHRYVEMLQMLPQMNPLAHLSFIKVKWMGFIRQNVQVPTFEVGASDILGFGGHQYVEIIEFTIFTVP